MIQTLWDHRSPSGPSRHPSGPASIRASQLTKASRHRRPDLHSIRENTFMRRLSLLTAAFVASASLAAAAEPDWKKLDEETLKHFQTLIRFDTTDPPGNEKPAADYLVATLKAEGIDVK